MCLLGTLSFGAVAVAMLLLLPAALVKKTPGAIIGTVITILIGLVCLADIFCQEYYSSPLNSSIVRLIRDTTPEEAGNFFSAFVRPEILGRWRIAVCLALIIAAPFAAGIKLPKAVLALMLVPGIIGLFHMQDTPPGRLAVAVAETNRQHKELEKIRQACVTIQADSCSFLSSRIVLVIGESFNKHHASAYGYPLQTTPFQDAHKADGSLVLFTDAVTPWNITDRVMEKMLAVPFPAILKKAGYTVNFYSNQNPATLSLADLRQGQKGVMQDTVIMRDCFSNRNARSRRYDHLFLEESLPSALTEPPVLDIIQLKGQHFDYNKHYPPSFARFTMDDYPQGTHEEVMHYDNATYYNDYVLESILQYYSGTDAIVIFLADHGEEVFDEKPISGRTHGKIDAAVARAEFEVPMWIWCSQEYASKHSEIVSAIHDAAERPFYTANISHMILSLAGAHGPFQETNGPRILAGKVDYEAIIP